MLIQVPALALRPFSPQIHCTCLLPILSTSTPSRRTILERFFGRNKKKREILDPLDPKFRKGAGAKAKPPPQEMPKQGDIAPGSIIDDEPAPRATTTPTPRQEPLAVIRTPWLRLWTLSPETEGGGRGRW